MPRPDPDQFNQDQGPTRPKMSSPSFFQRTKKLSVPNLNLGTHSTNELSSSSQSSPKSVPPRPKGAKKKLSLASSPVPVFCFGASPVDDDGDRYEKETDAVKCLESAARKISRGSPSRSPNRHSAPRLGGLVGLARGYEQYRESLRYLTPTVEYGEASSDDLSSEWESSDFEGNNNRSFTKRLALLTSLPPGTIQETETESSGNLLTVPSTDPQFSLLDEKPKVSLSHKSAHTAKIQTDSSSKKSCLSKRVRLRMSIDIFGRYSNAKAYSLQRSQGVHVQFLLADWNLQWISKQIGFKCQGLRGKRVLMLSRVLMSTLFCVLRASRFYLKYSKKVVRRTSYTIKWSSLTKIA